MRDETIKTREGRMVVNVANNLYCIRAKPVVTPNSSPFAEGSGDSIGTLVPINSLTNSNVLCMKENYVVAILLI